MVLVLTTNAVSVGTVRSIVLAILQVPTHSNLLLKSTLQYIDPLPNFLSTTLHKSLFCYNGLDEFENMSLGEMLMKGTESSSLNLNRCHMKGIKLSRELLKQSDYGL